MILWFSPISPYRGEHDWLHPHHSHLRMRHHLHMTISTHYADIFSHIFLTWLSDDDYAAIFSHVYEISIYKRPLTILQKEWIFWALHKTLLYESIVVLCLISSNWSHLHTRGVLSGLTPTVCRWFTCTDWRGQWRDHYRAWLLVALPIFLPQQHSAPSFRIMITLINLLILSDILLSTTEVPNLAPLNKLARIVSYYKQEQFET